jgi:NADH dehydrogenase
VAWKGPIRISGFLAWLMWLFVHLIFLVGFRNRLSVLLQWTYSYFAYKRGARIIPGGIASAEHPARPGSGEDAIEATAARGQKKT